jgi:hypothetical protein
MKTKHIILSGALALSLTSLARAELTVDWGNDPFSSLFTSNGTSQWDSSYHVEMGTFGSVFTPDTSNMSLWSTNFISAQTLNDLNGGSGAGINLSLGYFTGTFALDSSNISNQSNNLFGAGQQMYIWAYKNDKTYTNGLEWALVTNSNWIVPTANNTPSSTIWRTSDLGTTPVFGGNTVLTDVNNFVQSSTQGAGTYTAPNLPGSANPNDFTPDTFELQTHTTTVAPVPEPSSVLLVGAAGVLGMLRRRRLLR